MQTLSNHIAAVFCCIVLLHCEKEVLASLMKSPNLDIIVITGWDTKIRNLLFGQVPDICSVKLLPKPARVKFERKNQYHFINFILPYVLLVRVYSYQVSFQEYHLHVDQICNVYHRGRKAFCPGNAQEFFHYKEQDKMPNKNQQKKKRIQSKLQQLVARPCILGAFSVFNDPIWVNIDPSQTVIMRWVTPGADDLQQIILMIMQWSEICNDNPC